MKYLSDSNPDYKILEELFRQRGYWQHIPEKPSIINRILCLNKSESKLPIEVPTRFDHPGTYPILSRIISELKAKEIPYGMPPELFPNYASTFNNHLSAMALSIEGAKKPFIVIDASLIYFQMLFGLLFAKCFPSTNDNNGEFTYSISIEEIEKQIHGDEKLIDEIIILLFTFATGGDLSKIKTPPANKNQTTFGDAIRESMHLTVIGHELGHIFWRHAKQGECTPEEHHRRELQADAYGIRVAIRYMQKMDARYLPIALIGIDLTLISLSLVDLVWEIMGIVNKKSILDEYSKTHPSIKCRREHLKQEVAKLFTPEPEANAALEFINRGASVSNAIYKAIKTRIQANPSIIMSIAKLAPPAHTTHNRPS